jgi:hypothetical protein
LVVLSGFKSFVGVTGGIMFNCLLWRSSGMVNGWVGQDFSSYWSCSYWYWNFLMRSILIFSINSIVSFTFLKESQCFLWGRKWSSHNEAFSRQLRQRTHASWRGLARCAKAGDCILRLYWKLQWCHAVRRRYKRSVAVLLLWSGVAVSVTRKVSGQCANRLMLSIEIVAMFYQTNVVGSGEWA